MVVEEEVPAAEEEAIAEGVVDDGGTFDFGK
jgi:hypothetical protein